MVASSAMIHELGLQAVQQIGVGRWVDFALAGSARRP